jgi:hypothetical protein
MSEAQGPVGLSVGDAIEPTGQKGQAPAEGAGWPTATKIHSKKCNLNLFVHVLC